MPQAAVHPESAGLRNAMVIATILGGLLLMLAAWPLTMSPAIFDSGESTAAWEVFLAIWAMPVVLLIGLAVGWIGFARNVHNVVIAGLVIAALPVFAAIGVLMMSGF